jgi:ligand-binding SRPBCC domain-containing protein
MLQFEKTSRINASPETVWKFYERPDILKLLTPPWQPIEIVRREGGLGVGAESEFRIWLGPFPVQWIAVHTDCTEFEKFVDVQKTGPMTFWQHQHLFRAAGDGCELIDKIDFSLPGGEIAESILGDWVKQRLSDMFDHRHQVTRDYCDRPSHPQG